MISKTQFAITGEDTRYFLNGALFVLEAGTMSLVATDGHRLALVQVPRKAPEGKESKDDKKAKPSGNDDVRVILPRKTLNELQRMLSEGDDDVGSRRARTTCSSRSAGALLISARDRRQFPASSGHPEEHRQEDRLRS